MNDPVTQLVALACLVLATGCGAVGKADVAYEACRVKVRAEFHEKASDCETEECVDVLGDWELAELKRCRR